MLQPTGSVYLDAPRPSAETKQQRADGARRAVANVLLGLGLLSLTLAALLGAFRVMIHDPETVMSAVDTALDDPMVRAELELEIADAITETLFGDQLVALLAGYGIDVDAEADVIAPMVLDDPAFRTALTDLVVTTHTRVLLETTDQPLDMTAVTAAVRQLIAAEVPQAEAILPSESALYEVSPDQIPDFTGPVELLDQAALAVAMGGLLVPLALVAHPQRHRVGAWVGRWLLVLGLVAALMAVGLPYVGGRFTGMLTVEIVIREITTRLLAPAAIAGIIGMGLASAAAILKKREESATADEGAAAALGFDEPLFDMPSSREMDLSHRGLVDVSHPLTNI
ncbi:MAG: hypothetical protein AAGE98_13440 [Actinomycetota bacterium]